MKTKTTATDARIEQTLAIIRKHFGAEAITRLGGPDELPPVDTIPSGSLGLDLALGVGGIPKGRITEIFGTESAGKTTLCLHIVAEAQKLGAVAAYVDAEHALDLGYAQAIGVRVEDMLLSQPDHGEQALEITEHLISTGNVGIVVVDSVAALTPKAELDGEMGDAPMASHARLMSQAMRKLCAVVGSRGCVLIFVNQLRSKVGVAYGNPEVTTGGNALKYYASARLDIRRIGPLKEGGDGPLYGSRVRVKVVKNKLARPFRETEFDLVWGRGIATMVELLDLAERNDLVKKSGSAYSAGHDKLGSGRLKAAEVLRTKPQLVKELREAIRKIGPPALEKSAERREAEAAKLVEIRTWAGEEVAK